MPGKPGRSIFNKWVSADRAASCCSFASAARHQSRWTSWSAKTVAVAAVGMCTPSAQRAYAHGQVVEVAVDVADPVLAVDQVRVHQRVAQDHQAVGGIVEGRR